jgi:hypothetical protein
MEKQIKKRLLWALLMSAAFTAFLVLKVEWSHFSMIAGRFVFSNIIFAFVLLFLSNIVRTLRFHKIDHAGNKLSHWWVMNQVYNFMTATLPGGAGEASTVFLLKKFSSFNIVSGIRILFLTRLMDLAGLSIVLFFASTQMVRITPYRDFAILISAIVFILSIVATHPKMERLIIHWMQKIPVQGRIIDKIRARFGEINHISEIHASGALFRITTIQSIIMIFIAALSVHYVLRALGTDFSYVQSFYCFGVYALFQIIPVQGVAGIGTQAAWWSIALSVSGYSAPDAIALGIVLHGTFYAFIALMGVSGILIVPVIRKPQ